MIQITGLTVKQKTLMEVMWSMAEMTQVQAFIKTLPRKDQMDCASLIEIAVQESLEQEPGRMELYEDHARAVVRHAGRL